ncbi:efflux RND transporter periplasmic adaptor subunit [Schlesneria sp.]|uniref:efflux RND transporter periplasmic adaptor subunit n=1 Tax=Schlesneria sp. TaxID=2762018 RepID=UPI002F0C7E0A
MSEKSVQNKGSTLPWGWGIVAVVGLVVAWNWQQLRPIALDLLQDPAQAKALTAVQPPVELVPEEEATLKLTSPHAAAALAIKVTEVRSAPQPEPLRLPGSLLLDPNRLVHVHSRFTGETVSIGQIEDDGVMRPLQYGDPVKKGQVIAVIWSKEVGEKKSELVDALSQLEMSRSLLKRLESVQKGVVTERVLLEARRDVEAGMIAVARAERTLRSWRMTDTEIETVRREYRNLMKDKDASDLTVDEKWAETEIRAAIDGVIVEKNFNVGDVVDPQDDLFKIADLSRLQVLANVYEEDLWAIRDLKPSERHWSIDLKSDPSDNQIQGTFELIGSMIDPAQRTGSVMGWLDNKDSRLLVGQFITATVQLPASSTIVAIPESALIEEGDSSTVFVATDAQQQRFSRRKVLVVKRTAGTVYINSDPRTSEFEPLHVGESVVSEGSLGLGGELANLQAGQRKS